MAMLVNDIKLNLFVKFTVVNKSDKLKEKKKKLCMMDRLLDDINFGILFALLFASFRIHVLRINQLSKNC